jgi:shikimate 5-dehydrogenase
MGYPVEMIGKDTTLYGIIGSSAIEHKLETYFNRYFQQMDIDAKAMPLNIREDDIGFFFNGLKESKIAAVYLESEYQQIAYELFKPDDSLLQFIKACDIVEIDNGTYRFSSLFGKALATLFDDLVNSSSVMIVGNTSQARSFLAHLIDMQPKKILFASPYIEEMLEMMAFIPETIKHDIFRIENSRLEIPVDIVFNFTNQKIEIETKKYIDVDDHFDKIIDKIAEIKTKEWAQNG